MEKPDVDQIDGLSPAISIDQKGASRNPRSTVGTVTEIYDHLRLLFARIGHPHCPNGHEIQRQSVQQIVDQILALPNDARILVLGPLIRDRKTEGDRVFDAARKQGFVRVRVDGEMLDLDEVQSLDKYKRHTIEVVVDRLVVHHADDDGKAFDDSYPNPERGRFADSVETALRLGEGVMVVAAADDGHVRRAALQREVQLPVRRLHDRRARAALVLVQLAARRVPGVHRSGHAHGVRSRAHRQPQPARSPRARCCRGSA